MPLTLERLKSVLSYDRDTGRFTRLVAANGRVRVGEVAGCSDPLGYILIKIDKRTYKAHRLAWLWMTGRWPSNFIDHINCISYDNRWVNLREANNSDNGANSRIYKNNKTGFKGVQWRERDRKFYAVIRKDRKTYHLGSFDDALVAYEAYCNAAKHLHGEFANSGRPTE